MPRPDVLCGGFPCQDISLAGGGAGIAGTRSGLWSHMARLVAECGPRWVVVENVPGLRGRGADRVLADLAALGYAGWPCVVGAAHAGAPHRRARVWIVAQAIHPDAGGPGLEGWVRGPAQPPPVLPTERRSGWPPAPGLCRVADGLSPGMDGYATNRRARVTALGNAVVPGCAAMIGRAIVRAWGDA